MTGWHYIAVDLRDRWVDEWVEELAGWPDRLERWLAGRPRGTGPPVERASGGADPYCPEGWRRGSSTEAE